MTTETMRTVADAVRAAVCCNTLRGDRKSAIHHGSYSEATLMQDHSSNPVVALCVAGMEVEGDVSRARTLFERAWTLRQDDFDASVAAHYLARLQPDASATLHWNEVALTHADRLQHTERASLLPSLCLNLGDSYRTVGRLSDARRLAQRGLSAVDQLPMDGYREFIRGGLTRLESRIAEAASVDTPSILTRPTDVKIQFHTAAGVDG